MVSCVLILWCLRFGVSIVWNVWLKCWCCCVSVG